MLRFFSFSLFFFVSSKEEREMLLFYYTPFLRVASIKIKKGPGTEKVENEHGKSM